jgi:multidrug efflux system membrane fusion protein
VVDRSRVFITLLGGALLAAGCSSKTSAAGMRRGGDAGAVPVVTASAVQKDVPIEIEAIGNVEAYETVAVRAQVTGQLTDVHFREGDFVKKGDLLFSLDRRPFEAAVQQAEANHKRDLAVFNQAQAQLQRDGAQAEYQQVTAQRQAELNQRGIISKDQAEQSRANADAVKASVEADRAAVESARAQVAAGEAAVDNARVQLSYATIHSPINGRTGDLAVKGGNLVTANTTQLMTIAQVEPVFVTFTVPAVHLPAIKAHMSDQKLPVVATPQDSDAQAANGVLAFVDNAVDPSTDTIKLKAMFANDDRRLWPGQFARVVLRLSTLQHATVVPTEAIQTGQDGQYVFIVKPDSTVDLRPVTTATRVKEEVVVEKGVSPGDVVVTEGQLRLEPGSHITTREGGSGGSGGGRRGAGGQGRQRNP